MKIPAVLSAIIVGAGAVLTWWMKAQVPTSDRYLELVISTWATVGALVSATFVVYGYLLSMRALVEAQTPKILIRVVNEQATLAGTGQLVHQTCINYSNIGTVECRNLALFAALVRNNECIEIPRLFREKMSFQVADARNRSFATFNYLSNNGIPQTVIDNIQHYKLRVGYKVESIGGIIERAYEYTWDVSTNHWNID